MKRIILALTVCTIMTGCASHPMRTGRLVVNQFEAKGYTTNNPLQVKDDVAERLAENLHNAILGYVAKDTKMTLAKDCSDGDYELVGKFEKIDSKIDSHWRFVTVTVNQNFDVKIVGTLKKCKTGETVVDFDSGDDDENMSSVIDNIADDVVSDVRKDESIVLP